VSAGDVIVQLRLIGGRAFNQAAMSSATAVRRIGEAGTGTGRALDSVDRAAKNAAPAVAAIGRMARTGALAVGALGSAAVYAGIDFNASMEQSKVAITNLTGSSQVATKMLDQLYEIAAKTPFEFQDLTKSAAMMLGFGYETKKVLPFMRTLGDAVAGVGGGAETINRLTRAFGQMQAKGRIQTEELMQLAEAGIPAFKILQKQLGLTGDELRKKIEGGALSADEGISALLRGMNQKYEGMAKAQSKTFKGQISTLKDYFRQTMGAVTMPLFNFMRSKLLPKAIDITKEIGKWAKGGGVPTAITAFQRGGKGMEMEQGGGINSVMETAGQIGGKAFSVLAKGFQLVSTYATQLWTALKPAQPFLQNVLIPLFTGFGKGILTTVVMAFKILLWVVKLVAPMLGWLGTKLAPLKGAFEFLGFIIGSLVGPWMLKLISYAGRLGFIFKILVIPIRIARGVLLAVGKVFGVVFKAVKLLGPLLTWIGNRFLAVGGFVGRMVLRIWSVIDRLVAFKTRMINWAKGLVSGVGTALRRFTEFGGKIINWLVEGIKRNAGKVLDALMSIMPKWMRKGFGKVAGAAGKLKFWATGGVQTHAGYAVVGEAGPELVHLPGGTRITPLSEPSIQSVASGSMAGSGQTTANFWLDRKLIATAVASDVEDRIARR
jgi:tape measure domain-containing protein